MRTIGSAKFKEQCLSLLDHVEVGGLLITKRGKPVARLVPVETESADLIGSLRDKIKILGNIFSTGVRWDAQS